MEGWPAMGWPPFQKLISSGTTVHKELAVLQEDWQSQAAQQGESARQAAQEAMAARVAMSAAMQAAQLNQGVMRGLLQRMTNDPDSFVPTEVDTKVIYQLTKSLAASTEILNRAFDIQEKRAGAPENTLGTFMIELLERCTDGELELVVRSGALPNRVLDHRKVIDTYATADVTEAEARALEAADIENAQDVDGAVQGLEDALLGGKPSSPQPDTAGEGTEAA